MIAVKLRNNEVLR